MNTEQNEVLIKTVENLTHQVSQLSLDVAVLKAQCDILKKENEELKNK